MYIAEFVFDNYLINLQRSISDWQQIFASDECQSPVLNNFIQQYLPKIQGAKKQTQDSNYREKKSKKIGF